MSTQLQSAKTAFDLAEKYINKVQAVGKYIEACNNQKEISKESLLILRDILEILTSEG